jgi:hypothetical protein
MRLRGVQQMKYRQHRGSLADSMATVVEVEGRAGLIAQLRKELAPWATMDEFPDKAVHIDLYFGDDDRIGWKNVGIVTLDGYGVIGFVENWNGD